MYKFTKHDHECITLALSVHANFLETGDVDYSTASALECKEAHRPPTDSQLEGASNLRRLHNKIITSKTTSTIQVIGDHDFGDSDAVHKALNTLRKAKGPFIVFMDVDHMVSALGSTVHAWRPKDRQMCWMDNITQPVEALTGVVAFGDSEELSLTIEGMRSSGHKVWVP